MQKGEGNAAIFLASKIYKSNVALPKSYWSPSGVFHMAMKLEGKISYILRCQNKGKELLPVENGYEAIRDLIFFFSRAFLSRAIPNIHLLKKENKQGSE